MGLKQTTAPSTEPVTLPDVLAAIGYEDNDKDSLVNSYIAAARQYCEDFTNRQFVTATWTLTLDRFPSSVGVIHLPRPPLSSITSITYLDSAGDLQTLDAADYIFDDGTDPHRARVTPAYGETWPSTQWRINAVTIVYVAGYGAAAAVPDGLKAAIYMLVGHWFDMPEPVVIGATASEVPKTVDTLLWQYRLIG